MTNLGKWEQACGWAGKVCDAGGRIWIWTDSRVNVWQGVTEVLDVLIQGLCGSKQTDIHELIKGFLDSQTGSGTALNKSSSTRHFSSIFQVTLDPLRYPIYETQT